MSKTVKYIALVETSEDVEEILSVLSNYKINPFHISWLPVEIDADITLRQKGIVPIAPTELLSIEDRKKILFDALELSEHWLDNIEIDNEKVIFKQGFSVADLIKNNIYLFFDQIAYLIAIIENAIVKLRPEKLIVSSMRPEKVRGIDHSKEYYLRRVGRIVAQKHNIQVLEIKPAHVLSIERNLKKAVQRVYGATRRKIVGILFHTPKREAVYILDRNIKKKLDGKKILVLGGGVKAPFWRLESLCNLLNKTTNCKLLPLYYSNDRYKKIGGVSLSEKRGEIEKSVRFLELKNEIQYLLKKELLFKKVIYRGIDLSKFLNEKLFWILREYLPKYWLDYLTLEEVLQKEKFDLLIGAALASSETSFLAALHCFENANIPTLLIPHGVQFCKYSEKVETKKAYNFFSPFYYSHVAVVGKYVEDKFVKYGIEDRKIRCTGNLESFNTRKVSKKRQALVLRILNLSSHKKTIVYFLGRATRNFHMSYINITFDEVKESICDVINVANALECQLVIKPHPAFSNAADWIISWAPTGEYQIITDPKVNAILFSIADIVIASKSSVAIESLEYKIPTIIFEHEQRELQFFEDLSTHLNTFKQNKEQPFVRATGFEDLLHACKTILNDRNFALQFQTRCEEMDPWIYHNRDGQQVKRIMEFMGEIIEQSPCA